MGLFDQQHLSQVQQRACDNTWAAVVLQAIRTRADAWRTQPGDIPTAAGGWLHQFVCPESWSALIFDPTSPATHRSPEGRVYTGATFDAAWRVLRHRQIGALARDLALMYAMSDDDAYARAAAAILHHYAEWYEHFDGAANAQPWMLKGRTFHQALTEALWAVPIVQAYDLIQSTLAADQATHLVQKLLRPMVATLATAQDHLLFEQHKVHSNYNAWLIAALGCLGFALRDEQLIVRALDDQTGFRAHLATAIRSDGFEYEGSPYYHNFVALAYTILAESARVNGIDLYAERGPHGQSIESTWHALATLVMPDGTFPQANDGAYWSAGPFDAELCEVYEVALARSDEPLFAWLLNCAYQRRDTPRDQWTALLFGTQDLAGYAAPALESSYLEETGIAVLRDSTNPQVQAVYTFFGPYGGAHGHFDRLALHIWPWSSDSGTPPYGVQPRVSWYQQTAAHNTIVVDEQSQHPCEGQLCSWHPTAQGGALWVTANMAYPGVSFSRLVMLEQGCIIDHVTLSANEEHIYDWLLHSDGPLTITDVAMVDINGSLGDSDAYQFLTLTARGTCARSFVATAQYQAQTYRVTLTADVPFEVLTARAPGLAHAPAHLRHVLIVRAQQRRVSFLMHCEEVQDA